MNTTMHPHPMRPWRRDRGARSGPGQILDLGRVLIGLVVIAIGVLYLLEQADVLDAGATIDDWWPTVIVAVGLFQLAERSHGLFGPLLLCGAGGLLLLATTDVLEGNVWDYAWPIALIALGLLAIVRWAGAGPLPRDAGDDVVVASGVFGGPTIVNASQHFQGASLTAIFGGVELDLRGAQLAAQGARINATAVFGGIAILVPHGWRIALRATPIFGGAEDKTEHDRDLPDDAPVLHVDALAAFGGVDIKHDK